MTHDERIDRLEKMMAQVLDRINSMEHEINQLFLRWEEQNEQTVQLVPVCQKVITYDNRREN